MKPNTTTIKEKFSNFWFGNKLDGQPTPPAPQPTTAKRTSDSQFTRPPKRQRPEDDVNRDIQSVASSSEVADQPHLTGSPYRNGLQDSQSVRSSGNRRRSGVELRELRATEQMTGIGPKKRSRHKPVHRPLNGSVDDGPGHLRKTTPSSAYFSNRSLQHIRNDNCSDPIQDDEDVIPHKNPSGTNGRVGARVSGTPTYTQSTFMGPDAYSEDELSAPGLSVSQGQPAKHSQGVLEEQANTGRKRAAEVDENGRKRIHPAKRRPGISSRADMQRSQFSSKATQTQSERNRFRVVKAVCAPTCVYPAKGFMRDDMPGASEEPCYLVPVATDGMLRFEAVDDTGIMIPELDWIIPSIATMTRITSNPNAPGVQIKRPRELCSATKAGPVLYVWFESYQDAKDYIQLCHEANKSIQINSGTSDM